MKFLELLGSMLDQLPLIVKVAIIGLLMTYVSSLFGLTAYLSTHDDNQTEILNLILEEESKEPTSTSKWRYPNEEESQTVKE